MDKFYAGIGSRETPSSLKPLINSIVEKLEAKGFTLRSGGANGADSFFEEKATKKEIYLPWKGFNKNESTLFNVTQEALEFAKKYHPKWENLSEAGQKFMGRNGYQVLGLDLKTPVEFIICWTPEGKMTGGTSQAMRIARDMNIPIYNLCIDKDVKRLMIVVGETPIF